MFIHIGDNEIIESNSIIAIVEKELFHSSEELRHLIEQYKEKKLVCGSLHEAKSIVITTDCIYYSPFSTYTLKNRDELHAEMEQSYGLNFD